MDPSASGEAGKVCETGEGVAPSAVIEFNTDAIEDEKIHQKADAQITANQDYNAMDWNCTSFAVTAIKSAVTIDGTEFFSIPTSAAWLYSDGNNGRVYMKSEILLFFIS